MVSCSKCTFVSRIDERRRKKTRRNRQTKRLYKVKQLIERCVATTKQAKKKSRIVCAVEIRPVQVGLNLVPICSLKMKSLEKLGFEKANEWFEKANEWFENANEPFAKTIKIQFFKRSDSNLSILQTPIVKIVERKDERKNPSKARVFVWWIQPGNNSKIGFAR